MCCCDPSNWSLTVQPDRQTYSSPKRKFWVQHIACIWRIYKFFCLGVLMIERVSVVIACDSWSDKRSCLGEMWEQHLDHQPLADPLTFCVLLSARTTASSYIKAGAWRVDLCSYVYQSTSSNLFIWTSYNKKCRIGNLAHGTAQQKSTCPHISKTVIVLIMCLFNAADMSSLSQARLYGTAIWTFINELLINLWHSTVYKTREI